MRFPKLCPFHEWSATSSSAPIRRLPDALPREVTHALWSHLKTRLKDLGLASAPPPWSGKPDAEVTAVEPGDGTVLRSKVDCLRICEQGAICVVYPGGDLVRRPHRGVTGPDNR